MPLPDEYYRQLREQELARTRAYVRGRPPTEQERRTREALLPHTKVQDGTTREAA